MDCFKRKRFYFATLISLPLFSAVAQADNPYLHAWNISPTYLVMNLGIGPVWESAGRSETFHLTPRISRTYLANHATHTLAEGEFFIGLQRVLTYEFQGQLGLEFATASNATLSGVIWDDANPQFNNYRYNYKIRHSHIAVAGKILMNVCEGYVPCYGLIPWLGGSVGVGFNNAYGFTNRPTIFEAVPTPNFGSHMQTTYTYTVKVGAQLPLTCHWQVGANYEFADWGLSQLDRASGQTLHNGLQQRHLFTNGLIFNMTYFA